jgi:mono/diheme cytochrome c family protein
MPAKPEGAIPVDHDKDPLATARAKIDAMPAQTRKLAQATAYGRYCSHCHGENGDNRTIVGESFAPRLPDLRLAGTQAKGDRELYNLIMHGSALMVPLDDTVTPVEAVLAIDQVRTLAGAPSRPLFPPKSTKPIR